MEWVANLIEIRVVLEDFNMTNITLSTRLKNTSVFLSVCLSVHFNLVINSWHLTMVDDFAVFAKNYESIWINSWWFAKHFWTGLRVAQNNSFAIVWRLIAVRPHPNVSITVKMLLSCRRRRSYASSKLIGKMFLMPAVLTFYNVSWY